jgi:hypothetical protein
MELLKRYKGLIVILPLLVGFRTFINHTPWDVNAANAANKKLFIKYSNATTNVSNDLSASDPLAKSGSKLTVKELMDSIFEDINGVGASYLELVDTDDADYSARKENREVTITFDGATGGNSGEAQFEYGDDGRFSTCTITADSSLLDNAEFFIKTITHEIGHCLGLDHPQETTNSVMSYYSSRDTVRFQIDDKMGLIYLYPIDSSAASEDNTFGMSCSRR